MNLKKVYTYQHKIMLIIPSIISYTPYVVNTIEINAGELVTIPRRKARDLALPDRAFYKLLNQIFDDFRRYRYTTS